MWTSTRRFLLPLLGFTALSLGLFKVLGVQAATKYVSPTGTGTACTQGSPCALSTANSQVVAGDVVYLAAGTYTTNIAPNASGTGWAPGTRITYIGDPVTPSNVVLTNPGILRKSYITIRGMKYTPECTIQTPTGATTAIKGDSIVACELDGGFSLEGVQQSIVVDCTASGAGGQININTAFTGTGATDFIDANRDTIQRVRALRTLTSDRSIFKIGHDQVVPDNGGLTPIYGCLIDRFHLEITQGVGSNTNIPIEIRGLQTSTVRNSYFGCVNIGQGGIAGMRPIYNRERVVGNVWDADTFYAAGPTGASMMLDATGDASLARSGDNNYTNCVFRNESVNGEIIFESGIRSDTLISCQFVGRSLTALGISRVHTKPEEAPNATGVSYFNHCTFATFTAGQNAVEVSYQNGWDTTGRIKFDNCAFYKPSSSGSAAPIYYRFPGAYARSNVEANNNAYINWTSTTNQGDRSIRWQEGGVTTYSRPGVGTAWYNATNTDGTSGWAGLTSGGTAATTGGWGGPAFTDTSSYANFNSLPTASSQALLTRGTDCADIGALQLTAAPGAPSAVTSLTANPTSLYRADISWDAPSGCGGGPVTEYQIVLSQTTPTEGNFTTLNRLSPPIPAQPGVRQGVTAFICPGYTYYISIRSRVGTGAWSSISTPVPLTSSTVPSSEPCEVE